jgi:hypothetical protein
MWLGLFYAHRTISFTHLTIGQNSKGARSLAGSVPEVGGAVAERPQIRTSQSMISLSEERELPDVVANSILGQRQREASAVMAEMAGNSASAGIK